jgi:glutathionylspermidine synthase
LEAARAEALLGSRFSMAYKLVRRLRRARKFLFCSCGAERQIQEQKKQKYHAAVVKYANWR